MVNQFVDYWRRYYKEGRSVSDSEFVSRLKLGGTDHDLNETEIQRVFLWKEPRRLPAMQGEKVFDSQFKINKLNSFRFKASDELVKFAKEQCKNADSSLVKRYFICHIASPYEYPIWDRNALRAHLIITNRLDQVKHVEELIYKSEEYEEYRRNFNSWSKDVSEGRFSDGSTIPSFRMLDQALFSMGYFANSFAPMFEGSAYSYGTSRTVSRIASKQPHRHS